MKRYLVTAPVIEPITVDEIKTLIRFDLTTDDTLLKYMIESARRELEENHNTSFLTQTVEMKMDEFPEEDWFYLRWCPVQSVTSLTYLDSDGSEQTLTEDTDFKVDLHSYPNRIYLMKGVSWPTVYDQLGSITIRFVTGYGDTPEEVPDAIKMAIASKVADMHSNVEDPARQYRTMSENIIQPFSYKHFL